MIEGTVAAQFAAVGEAAEGCDVIVGGGALAIAAHSVSEKLGIRYEYASFAAITLPSSQHPPLILPMAGWQPKDPEAGNLALWAEDAEHWNELWAGALNSQRAKVGLAPVDDVRRHIFTDTPWLAADPTLGPWLPADDEVVTVTQTGAWILPDQRPLSVELEEFLDAGEAPVYFGFGSMRASGDLSKTLIAAGRALGRRAVVARGWAGLALPDDGTDILSIGEVNQQELFKRVALAVHHGGAGTTTAAGGAGVAQVIVPQMYDQFYWANRVTQLGIGAAHAPGVPTVESLAEVLDAALQAQVGKRAKEIQQDVRLDGADAAAKLLLG
ncbi:MAG: vancomycin aglycone glucosyltransferase [Kribbellaceae bacterium]|nr:vancomycin aglycone glucosyltransferase [Kribbellaceae bacterium]